jgi:transducin (beta)-like 1
MLLTGGSSAISSSGSGTAVGAFSTVGGPQVPSLQAPINQQRSSWQRVADKTLPPGALISFLQKGLQYVGIEESLLRQQEGYVKNPATVSIPADFSLLSPASIQSLTRRNPPILLTVPPAAAAAAVKARLESEVASNQFPVITFQHDANSKQSVGRASHVDARSLIQQHTQPNPLSASLPTSLSGPKRSRKKQKVEHSVDVTGISNASLSTLEQAALQLETAEVQRQLLELKPDVADTMDVVHAVQQAETNTALHSYLINGLQHNNPQHDISKQNGSQQNKNGDLGEKGQRKNIGGRGGEPGSFYSSTSEMADEDDDNDESRASNSVNVEDAALAAKPEEVLQLMEHHSEVFMCAWNLVFTNLIATGSGDATARIWEMNDVYANAGLKSCIELPHGLESGDRRKKDVTTLEWSSDGLLLATGSYDGFARVWDRNGTLVHTLRGHQGPIFSLKWNRRGNFLLSGSYDKTIIVWNLLNGNGSSDEKENATHFIEHQFKHHEAPALDVDWKDDTTFASCSSDRTVHIYNVNVDSPTKVYTGHTDEVNAVKWSPSGKYLASCSDDCTAKVWEIDSDRAGPLYDFVSHDQEIYTIKWSPTGPGSSNSSKQLLLATASFDGSIRLWNMSDGSCFGYFNRHRDSVYSVAFSPSGDFLASGSLAGQMYIWDVSEGLCIKSFKGKGDIFEVAWNKQETRVAACFSSNVVALIDFVRPTKQPVVDGQNPSDSIN